MKLLAFSTAILLSVAAFGQKSAQVTAYNYMKDAEFTKAYDMIKKASEHEKTANDPKTYYYMGQILMAMAGSQDVEQRTYVEDPLQKGVAAWKKCLKLDTKEKYSDDIKMKIPQTENMLLNMGVKMYNEEKFAEAYELFKTANIMASVLDQSDSLAIFNAAVSAEKAGQFEDAIEMYKLSSEIQYQTQSSILSMAKIYKENLNDTAAALNTLKEARTAYPNDQGLIIEELNIYLQGRKFQEAADNLELAIKNDPENAILHYALGSAYDNMGNIEKAKVSYKKALELKPDYFDAAYNYGAMVYNQGVELTKQANELDYRTKGKQIDALNAKANEKFKEAVVLLENAHNIDPEDKSTISSLTQLYVRLKMNDKYKEMKAKL
ncbi:tetratricopeptide repeat protein [Luteibaculum oceani]|nr:tetratricopeptide repeat protein [Luteibaculum oceani]